MDKLAPVITEADKQRKGYNEESFSFTFTRSEISAIIASIKTCLPQLTTSPFAVMFCTDVLTKIKAHKEYQESKLRASKD